MPLRDHFHPPLYPRHHWDTFHGRWAYAIADVLNGGLLPPGYMAEGLVTLGRIEVDVASLEGERNGPTTQPTSQPSSGGIATLTEPTSKLTTHSMEMSAVYSPAIRVHVLSDAARDLVGAIELVSPANKDRPAKRRAFAVKCLSYLQNGVGLIIADIVTERHANLHDEMAELIVGDAPRFPGSPGIYAAAYRPFKRGEEGRIGVWPVELTLGAALPVLPLWLRNHETAIRIDLEAAYVEACQKCAIS